MNDHNFTLQFPLNREHLGLPLGNGSVGILVWGGERELKLTAAHGKCWDHRYSEKLWKCGSYEELLAAWTPHSVDEVNRLLEQNRFPFQKDKTLPWWGGTKVGGGTFVFQLHAEVQQISLEYRTGIATVKTKAGDLSLELDIYSDQLRIADPEKLIIEVTPHPMWEQLRSIFEPVGFSPPEFVEGGWFQRNPADPGFRAACTPAQNGWRLQLTLQDHSDDPGLSEPQWEKSRQWWNEYWERMPSISLPDSRIGRFFQLALYKFAASTVPGKTACSLQGLWQEDYQKPQWNNDYHFNVNIQQIYTLGLSIGVWENMDPLFDMLESPESQRTMRENARALFGLEDGLLLTHAVDDRCMQVGGCHAGGILDFVCGGWMALLYWQRFRYSGDLDFLKRRAMPFMRGVMNVFLATLREESDGSLSIPLAISAEYGCIFPVEINGKLCHQNTGKNPSNQLTCCHALANALMEGAKCLGEESDSRWFDVKKRLPRFSVVNDRVAIWEKQDLDVCHRHHSHLSMIYPFDLTAELTEDELRQVDNAVEHWIWRGTGQWSEWCYPWAMIIQSRWNMRESPSVLLEVWRRLFLNESCATVYLPKFRGISSHRKADMLKPKEHSEIMQLDGTMAGATAILEMLIHEKGGIIEFFPAIPEEWPDVEFQRIALPGNLRVSAIRRSGRLVHAEFSAGTDLEIRVSFHPGEVETLCLHAEKTLVRDF